LRRLAKSSQEIARMKVLAVDIGGTKIKALATGQLEPRKAISGRGLTPGHMVELVRDLAQGWEYEAISIGYPGLVGPNGPRSEPGNLGPGWVGFDYAAAFDHPVKITNDAAMQALGSYEGGRMLFLGLGTGLGSALIAENVIIPLELGRLPFRRRQTLGEVLGRAGLKKAGKVAWKKQVAESATTLMGAFITDYVVLGGGNAKLLKIPPPGCRMGHNLTAFRGGFRLWGLEGVPVLGADELDKPAPVTEWRLIG
jgi:predicted NBD/HSP70 family sugar kinase